MVELFVHLICNRPLNTFFDPLSQHAKFGAMMFNDEVHVVAGALLTTPSRIGATRPSAGVGNCASFRLLQTMLWGPVHDSYCSGRHV
jgi:hypothetical protein